MDSSLMNLIAFCKKYKAVVCYGASDHGYMTKHFLNEMGITVAFFMISDPVKKGEKRDGIPIYSVSETQCMSENYGIILSLYERHHETVLANLKNYFNRFDGIFALQMPDLRNIRLELLKLERNKEFQKKVIGNRDFYRKRIHEIKQTYQKVLVRYIDVRRLGAYALWGYYLYERKMQNNNIFYLYYPVVHAHRKEEYLKGSNGYLLSKLSAAGIEVISEDNVDFWRNFFQENEKIFCFDNNYVEWGWRVELEESKKQIAKEREWIRFSEAEKVIYENELKKMNIKKPFVCISSRDIAYLQGVKRDKRKMDFRDFYRNSNIDSYKKAIGYLCEKQVNIVRMGACVSKKIANEYVIDYASLYRKDFLDVYLGYKCKFFVSDLSGIQVLAMFFSKPMVVLNAPLLSIRGDSVAFFSRHKDIVLLKKMWDCINKKYLSIREMMEVEQTVIFNNDENIQGNVFYLYKKRRVVAIDNSSKEILAVIKEMNERIDGSRVYDLLDETLQQKFFDIMDEYSHKENFIFNWRLGADFLKDNQWLLD